MASTPGFEPREPHWWEANALTTASPIKNKTFRTSYKRVKDKKITGPGILVCKRLSVSFNFVSGDYDASPSRHFVLFHGFLFR